MKSRKVIKYVIILVLLIVLCIGTYFYFNSKNNKDSKTNIKVISPVIGDIELSITTTGTIEPQNRLEVKPPINGRIEEILVNEGEKVRKGQILAWMSSVDRAALLDNARSQGEDVLKYWKDVYKPTPLISPIDGEVIVRVIEPGQTVTSNTAVVVISDRLIVRAQVDETDIGKVKLGQTAIVKLDAYPDIEVKAKVNHISYEATVVNNVTIYKVDILMERIPSVFRSGMSANVRIIQQRKKNVLTIPVDVVRHAGKSSFVLVSNGKDSKPERRDVELGISDLKNVEVISGLTLNDKIILDSIKYELSKSPSNVTENPLMPRFGRGRR
jgi:macrolide-specific efflux system membrane fusion protein